MYSFTCEIVIWPMSAGDLDIRRYLGVIGTIVQNRVMQDAKGFFALLCRVQQAASCLLHNMTW